MFTAALAALDARSRQVPAPTSMRAVSAYLLSREQTHWRALHRRAEDGYCTDALAMRRAAYLATLVGTLPRTDARDALIAVAAAGTPAEADLIIDDHMLSFPSSKQGEVLEPIRPDRLGEDFIALATPGYIENDDTAWLSDDWTIDAATRLLTGDVRRAASALPRFVDAASRWPHLVSELLCPLLRRQPDLAMVAGGTVLARIAGLSGIDPAVLIDVEQQLPDILDTGLEVAAAALSVALYDHRLSAAPDPIARADLHFRHADRLAQVARYQEAIAVLDEAIAIYRALLDEGAAVQVALGFLEAMLARGNSLAEVGRLDEAIVMARETESMLQQIVSTDPVLQTAALPLIAVALSNLGKFLHSAGQPEDARIQFEQAVAIHRRSDLRYQGERNSLATSLMGLAATLYDMGDAEPAAAAAEEALSIRRALVEADPAAHLSDLAGTLSSIAVFAVDAESSARALALLREGIEIARRLAEANPRAHQPLLAVACMNLGSMLIRLDRLTEALAPTEEAVAVFRLAMEFNPVGLRDKFCLSLNNLDLLLVRLELWEEAIPVIMETLPMLRERAVSQQIRHLRNLAESLARLWRAASKLDLFELALAAAQEEIVVGRRLIEHDSAKHLSRLGQNLLIVGLSLQRDDQSEEASIALEEAIGIFRGIAVADAAAETGWLATALANQASCLTTLKRPAEAVVLAEEAVEIYERLSDYQAAPNDPLLEGQALLEVARARLATGRQLRAGLNSAHATVRLCGAHMDEQPELTRLMLDAIQTIAGLLDALGQPEEAAELRRQMHEVEAGNASTIAIREPPAVTPTAEPQAATSPANAALLNEGAAEYQRGDTVGAFASWLTVSFTRDPASASKAEYNLGILYADQGNTHDAELLFRRVASSTDPEVAPKAAIQLAMILHDAGDIDGARGACRIAYRAATQRDDRRDAVSVLSKLLENGAHVEHAAAVLWGAFRAGDSAAILELSEMWLRHDEIGASTAALRHAANLGDPAAAFNLGLLLQESGDYDGAAAIYRRLIQMREPHHSSQALLNLGALRFQQNDWTEARELWQRCLDARQSHTAPLAAANLGRLFRESGDIASSREAWRYVIDNGEPGLVAEAVSNLESFDRATNDQGY